MTIDKEKLITLLVEKTGSDPEHVGRQLSQLVYRIRTAAEEGKSFEIEGLGTFSLKNDQLQFTPDNVLETEINNKYTGMKPIELIGAFKGADVDAGDIEISDEPPKIDKPKTEAEIEQERWAFDEASASEQQRIEKAVFGTTFDDETEKPTKPLEAAEAPEPAKREPVVRKKETASKGEEDTIGKVLTIAAIILVVGLVGWLIYDAGLIGKYTMNDQNSLQDQTEQRQQVQLTAVQAKNEDIKPAKVSEPTSLTGVTSDGDETSSQTQSRYGLKGDLNNSVNTGYTIVIHSLNLERANAIKRRLHAQGFRVMIMDAVVNDRTYYRVGLGQFQSIEAAQQATNQLPEQYQNDNFIKRF